MEILTREMAERQISEMWSAWKDVPYDEFYDDAWAQAAAVEQRLLAEADRQDQIRNVALELFVLFDDGGESTLLDWIVALAADYDRIVTPENDEDPTATAEMLLIVRRFVAAARKLIDAIDPAIRGGCASDGQPLPVI